MCFTSTAGYVIIIQPPLLNLHWILSLQCLYETLRLSILFAGPPCTFISFWVIIQIKEKHYLNLAYRNSWTLDASVGRWTLDTGFWTLNSGRWTLDAEARTLDLGRWTVDAGLWTLDAYLFIYFLLLNVGKKIYKVYRKNSFSIKRKC